MDTVLTLTVFVILDDSGIVLIVSDSFSVVVVNGIRFAFISSLYFFEYYFAKITVVTEHSTIY